MLSFNEKMKNLLEEKELKNQFSGSVMVTKDKESLFSGAYGYANRDWNIKNTVRTRFRVASVSKMFTSIAVLQLIEKGKLDFLTSVVDFLDLKDSKIGPEVTVFNLLTHTSGITDYYDESTGDEGWETLWSKKPLYTVRKLSDFAEMFVGLEPENEVGEKFKYNNGGYVLLGLAIEKASGMSYSEYLKKNIFEPLGMEQTDLCHLDDISTKAAEGYEYETDDDGNITRWYKNIYAALPAPSADGGATSSVEDMITFIDAVKEGELLSEEMTEMFLKPHVLDQDSDGVRGYKWQYGFANWFISKDDQIVRGGHTGEEYGVSCRLYYYPEKGINVVILGNQGWCAGALGWDIHELILESFL